VNENENENEKENENNSKEQLAKTEASINWTEYGRTIA
jgi:hypothetical protein